MEVACSPRWCRSSPGSSPTSCGPSSASATGSRSVASTPSGGKGEPGFSSCPTTRRSWTRHSSSRTCTPRSSCARSRTSTRSTGRCSGMSPCSTGRASCRTSSAAAPQARDRTRAALQDIADGLKAGENILLYPAGRLKRQYLEDIGSASGVETLVKAVPDARVVLVRHNGLWGSSFSLGFNGEMPDIGSAARPRHQVPPAQRHLLHAEAANDRRTGRADGLPDDRDAVRDQPLPRAFLQRGRRAQHVRAVRVLGDGRHARVAGSRAGAAPRRRDARVAGDARPGPRAPSRGIRAQRRRRRPAPVERPRLRQPGRRGTGGVAPEGIRVLGGHAREPEYGRRRGPRRRRPGRVRQSLRPQGAPGGVVRRVRQPDGPDAAPGRHADGRVPEAGRRPAGSAAVRGPGERHPHLSRPGDGHPRAQADARAAPGTRMSAS